MNYYERHIGDYLKDTAHLSLLEHGVYGRLLDLYYIREAPIEDAEAMRLISARTPAEKAAVRAVLAEFFDADGTPSLWRHKRCDAEIARFQEKRGKAKASADARWSQTERNANASDKSMRTHSDGNADGMPHAGAGGRAPSLQSPYTRPNEEISNLSVAPARPSGEPPQLALVGLPPGKPKDPPDCPHSDVLALWAEVLPSLPQHNPKQWKGARADHLRARWRETAVDEGWIDQSAGLLYLRRLFGYVAKSPFLTGRTKPRGDGRPFVIELEWLVSPTNWAKVIEGKYHQEMTA